MNHKVVVGAGLAAVVAGLGVWMWSGNEQTEPAPEPKPLVAQPEPAIQNQVPETGATAMPLPELENSDPELQVSATSLFGASAVEQWLIPNNVVRHFVVTVDNLPRKKFAERQKPIKAVPGRFVVEGSDEAAVISADNAARYAPLVQVVQALNMQTVAAEYFRLYPLFQASYKDLGYPDAYFNDRLIAAIDDLLAAPNVTGPIKLTQPNVMYEYADPQLESLSAGQKAMIRMGAANAAAVKVKLRELRAAVATGKAVAR
jgi:hypothetical protein